MKKETGAMFSLKHMGRVMCSRISPSLVMKIRFIKRYHRLVNMKKPIFFDEKLIILYEKNYCHNPFVTQCADKYLVRDYIENIGLGGGVEQAIWSLPFSS